MDTKILVTIAKIEVKAAARFGGLKPFGELSLNDRHIWRFDSIEEANIAADNLARALEKP